MAGMNVLDASWLFVESPEAPMHVAQLMILERPKNAEPDFLNQLIQAWRKTEEIYPPWNLRLANPALGALVPVWKTEKDIDIDYHLRHNALPKPGGERELGILVSRLHSHPLDFSRPLWECHIIEGLEGGRVAMYTKFHHSLIDGVSGVRMLKRIMSTSSRKRNMPPPWSVPPVKRSKEEKAQDAAIPVAENAFQTGLTAIKGQITSVPNLAKAYYRLYKASGDRNNALMAPFECPQSILNGRIGNARRFATQQYDMKRLKKLAKAAECTLNDLVLALCAASLRRFLIEAHALPNEPLTAGLPVNVRPAGDQGTGNAISFIMVTLATHIADPIERLKAIKSSTRQAKAHLETLPKEAMAQYTATIMAPFMIQLVSGLGGRMRSVFNVTISNVPGPEKPLYVNGAKLVASYPVSLIPHGQALNITCLSYAGTLNFGFTGDRDALPSMQNIAVYTGDALQELEHLIFKK